MMHKLSDTFEADHCNGTFHEAVVAYFTGGVEENAERPRLSRHYASEATSFSLP
jgi:hypothetical protein